MKKQDTELKPMGTHVPMAAKARAASSSRGAILVPAEPDSRRFDQLSDEQVVARIGQLLFEGYLLVAAEAKAPAKNMVPEIVPIRTCRRDKHELAVLELLRGGEAWTPKVLRSRVNCSRATISRVLKKLERSGAVVSSGKTKGISYCIARKEVRAA